MAISFFNEDIKFNLPQKLKHKNWLKGIAESEGFKIIDLNYIFCSDEYLHKINVEYLDHDTFTDIITFDNSEEEDMIEGDIFISLERVRENAKEEKNPFDAELLRVISHGLLHLMGYKDKTENEAREMRLKEDQSISSYQVM
ncbi:rRNA maturation RNase YbeY [Belliella kenyensis]|uniref:Endoribonuclease YbeY n=1 Tax=Belliella kenyensis TaxID=1472724 RepID=A0ABV8ENL5_9BACT|nr:rRNA maturation RNase YbeY [Belliella kenyensis]MCH7401681.1 rRNA maturation RNase YbeY [Belliella kenyensis]MDN3603041.1 rRNA maturation RNase YbeY [Belliella kenyensis]